MAEVVNNCAICGKEIEPEEEFCEECKQDKEPCPRCGKIICECDEGSGG